MFPSPRQARTLARGLGWFSIALGAVELLAARRVSRAVGLPGHDGLVRACGMREIVTGVGLLRSGRPAPWLWARVGGDVLDMATLSPGLNDRRRANRTGAGMALAAVAAVTLLDVAAARSLGKRPSANTVDYSHRSGWSRTPAEMRGVALLDFEAPRDMRIPDALRPWGSSRGQPASNDAGQGRASAAAGNGRSAASNVGTAAVAPAGSTADSTVSGGRSGPGGSVDGAGGAAGKPRKSAGTSDTASSGKAVRGQS